LAKIGHKCQRSTFIGHIRKVSEAKHWFYLPIATDAIYVGKGWISKKGMDKKWRQVISTKQHEATYSLSF
jgi:hypothetical protein